MARAPKRKARRGGKPRAPKKRSRKGRGAPGGAAQAVPDLCRQCTALCCRYITCEIAEPRFDVDFDEIRWFLCHDGVCVYVDEGKWNLQVMTRCKHLTPDDRCRVYEDRPNVCRDHGTEEDCEFTGPVDVELCFHTAEAFDRWTRANYVFV